MFVTEFLSIRPTLTHSAVCPKENNHRVYGKLIKLGFTPIYYKIYGDTALFIKKNAKLTSNEEA